MASATCIAVLNKDINQNSLQKLLWQPNTIVADLKDGSQLRYSRDVNNLESIPAPNGENKAGEIYENVLVESAKIYRDIEELFGETSIYPWWHRVVKSGNQGYTWSIAPQGGVIYNSRDDEDEHSSKEETRENKAVMAGKFETVYHLPKQIEKVMHHVVILNPTCKEILMLELEDDKITIPKKVLLETTREDLLAGPYMELINGEIYIPVKDKWQSGWLKTQKLLTITDLKGWDETLHVCKAEKTSIMAWKDIKRRWWKIEEVLELGDTPSNEVGLGIDFAIGQALVYLKKAEKQNK
jgi:hypothetical protein